VTLLSGVVTAQAAPGGKPRITLDEFFNAVDFSKVALSPDGHMVAIATGRADWDNERFRQDLWLWRDSDGMLVPLTQSGHDSEPAWSPDGTWIAFLSDRSGESDSPDKSDDSKKGAVHLYLIPVGGGEAFPATRGAEDVHSFAWSPDSKTLYFATRTPWTKKQTDDYKEQWKDVIRYREQERGDVISRIGLADAVSRQIAVGKREPNKSSKDKKKSNAKDRDEDEETGETPGAQLVVTSPYRVKSLAISPDGSQVAYSTDSVSQRFEGLNEVEIYVADTTKAGPQNAARQLTRNQALEANVRWSPDGRNVFFEVEQGSVEGAYADLQPRIYSVDAARGEPVRWAADFDGSVTNYALESNGTFLAPGALGTETALYQQASPQAAFQKLEGWPGTYAHAVTARNSPRIAFTHSQVDKPTEVYLAESAGKLSTAHPITSFNKMFTERDLPRGKPFRWTSDDGTPVEGMLLYPPGKFEATNLRLFVLIHGGPMDADGNYFGADWYNWAMYAASQGWLVFRPNYRGSSGYGDKFAMAIVPKIVSAPGRDILSGVDALVKAGIANPRQMTIGGYSYGGYLAAWLITQTTEFKAAVSGAGAVEHIGNWGNDDTSYDDAFFLGGLPWDKKARQNYIDEAAIFQFDKVKTPTHVVAGENDVRVAVEEDYLLEHALHTLGIPSSLLIFPDEGHELDQNPWHGKIKVREELNWLEKYCECPVK
jgi:dipeptidyl aminopeptidase/acylaminoacyl peptidase